MYPYKEIDEYAKKEIENINVAFNDLEFGREDAVRNEKFFNCKFVGCTFLVDQIVLTEFENCHFLNCIFTVSAKASKEKYVFSNTSYFHCSFLKCSFLEVKSCYEFMKECIFEQTIFRKTKLEGYLLSDVHFKHCIMSEFSLANSVAPLLLFKDCKITDRVDIRETKIGSLSLVGVEKESLLWTNTEIMNVDFGTGQSKLFNPDNKVEIPDFMTK